MADSEQIVRDLAQDKSAGELTALLTRVHSLCTVRYGSGVVSSSSAFYTDAPADDLTHYNREALIEELIRLHKFGITKGICLIDALSNMGKDTESQMQPFIVLFDALRQQRLNHLETVGEIHCDALMDRKYANREIERLQEQVSALQNDNDRLIAIQNAHGGGDEDDDAMMRVNIIPADFPINW